MFLHCKLIIFSLFVCLSASAASINSEILVRDQVEADLGIQSANLERDDAIIAFVIIPHQSGENIYLLNGDQALAIYEIPIGQENLSRNARILQIFLKEDDGLVPLHDELSDDVKTRILQFILEGRPLNQGWFDCACFTQFVMTGDYRWHDFSMCHKKRSGFSERERIAPGYALCFFSHAQSETSNNQLVSESGKHYGIYLGNGLIISLYGSGGGLRLTSLVTTSRDYFCAHAVVAFYPPKDPVKLYNFLNPPDSESDEEEKSW